MENFKKITLPLTYSDCDKYIKDSNFDYDNYYLQTLKMIKYLGIMLIGNMNLNTLNHT